MRTHRLKTWPEPFEALRDGRKRFEFRKDDRGFAVGDKLELYLYEPTELDCNQPLGAEELHYRVTYIARGQWGIPEGYVVMGIEETEMLA